MDFKKILFKTSSVDVEKSLPDGVILITKDGKIQWVNDTITEMLETSKMNLLTSNIKNFIENVLNLAMNAAIANKPVITKLIDKEMYFDMTARAIEEGFLLDFRYAAEITPVQEEKKEEDLTVNRNKNNFLIKLTNDLKAPIQSIVGFSQAMSDGLGGNMTLQQEKYIKIINKNSTELMYFIAKLLELSQTENEIKELDKKQFDILALANTVVKYNEQLCKGKEVRLTVKAEENLKKTVCTDSELIKNIMQDILEVILKSVDMGEVSLSLSTPDAELIEVKKLPKANYTLLSFSSSALLLSENDLECMFDPYKIVDSTNRKNVLRAIVLASVKNMVQALNGIVWVESKILKSTCFNVLIPDEN